MILEPRELREIYLSVVAGSGHPDPMGYMARILLTSGGEPDYLDGSGKMGLMPVTPAFAKQEVGSSDVATLEGNVMTTIAIDMKLFDEHGSIEAMVHAFHALGNLDGNEESKTIMKVLDDARQDTRDVILPRQATFDDVVDYLTTRVDPSDDTISAFVEILQGS